MPRLVNFIFFQDFWDDKTFVYQWEGADITEGGRYIDLNQNKMSSTPESCRGENDDAGCVRKNEWPDLPSTPLLACQGQCRDGQEMFNKNPTYKHT